MYSNLLKGRVSVVTGASKGIGRAIALRLAEEGSSIVLCGRNISLLNNVKKEIEHLGGDSIILPGDVTEPENATNVIEKAIKHYGKVDILVNNAGMNMRSATLDTSMDDWKRVMDVNLNASFYYCKAVLPYMVEANYGKIINISSRASKSPHKNAAPSYGASKAALNYLTKHIALEFAGQNIYVNGVCPGPIETDMTKQWSAEFREEAVSTIPLRRLGSPKDVANTVLFLASEQSDFITGETINVNGGVLMD